MSISKFSQRGQMPTASPMSIAIFFLFYFTFIQVLVFMVEGIVPMYLTSEVTWLVIGSAVLVVGALVLANFTERSYTGLTLGIGGAPITAWHEIHFALIAVVALDVGWPLLRGVIRSAMFTPWLIAIFIVIPLIAFSIAVYYIIMGSGGA